MTAKKTRGFTLIESILYFGLFAVIAGGGLAAAGGIIGTAARSADRVAVAEEANFLSAKIGWLLTGFDEAAGGVTSPATGESDVLEVRKPGIGVVRLEARGTDAVLTRANGAPNTLNGSGVRVTSLRFLRSGPEAVTAQFTLSSSSAGPVVRQDFELTKYLLP
jgi:type II secretory pathway pseudopilin PulG